MAHDTNKKDHEVRKYFGSLQGERDVLWKAMFALMTKAKPGKFTEAEKAKAERFLNRMSNQMKDLIQIRKNNGDPDEEDE